MTPPPDNADAVAEKIYKEFDGYLDDMCDEEDHRALVVNIAAALRSYGDEKLEEAAKIAESGGACECGCPYEDCPDSCASKIRSLMKKGETK